MYSALAGGEVGAVEWFYQNITIILPFAVLQKEKDQLKKLVFSLG